LPTFSKLQFYRGQYWSRLAVVAPQICEITRNSQKIRNYSSSRSSKVMDVDANRKSTCNFLLALLNQTVAFEVLKL